MFVPHLFPSSALSLLHFSAETEQRTLMAVDPAVSGKQAGRGCMTRKLCPGVGFAACSGRALTVSRTGTDNTGEARE